jgi:hypothetical protein
MISKQQLLLWFYLATPLFFLLDSLLGWNIRISSLDNYPGWKMVYYLFLFCIGLLMWKWRILESILGLVEGGVNMLLLTLSVLLPYYAAIDAISSGQAIETPLDAYSIINYLVSGLFLFISMQLRGVISGHA